MLIVLAGLLTACGPGTPARRDVVLGLVGEPPSALADHPSARVIAAAVTETLVRRDATAEFVPRLAVEVPTLQNGGLRIEYDDPGAPAGRMVATFRLRPEARWHDGRPVTADDVRFAWEEDKRARPGSEARSQSDRIEDIDVLAERLVRVRYRAGEFWDGYALAVRAMPRHVLAGASAEARTAYERAPMHAGPFSVAAWVSGFGVTLAAFPEYALGRPGLGRIEITFFADRGAALDALARGEIDIVPSPGLESDLGRSLDRLADGAARSRLLAYFTAAESVETLRFGARFEDLRLRRAIELVVDRQRVVETVFAGRVRVPRSYLVPPGRAAIDLGVPPPSDLVTARSLLRAAGYSPGRYGILQRGDDRLVFTILVTDGSIARLEATRVVAAQLAAVGIAADVRAMPAPELEALLASGAYHLAVVPEPAHDPQRAAERYIGRAGPWFDLIARTARSTADPAEQRLLQAELQRIYVEQVAGLPLYQYLAVDVAPRALVGIRPTPHLAPLTWNVAEWRFP